MKILVADDDRISSRMMERTLERDGYEVVLVADGLEAAHMLSRPGGPRLAVINWMMPNLDGPGLCQRIRNRQEGPYVYVMLLTAKQSHGDVVAGLAAGADDYLIKPCQPAELLARLHTGQRILQLEDKLVEAREQMRFKATHDGLTSLWNRSSILNLLKTSMQEVKQEQLPLSIILCDIDHFKRINDVHGHLAGDDVLRDLSGRLKGVLRSTDEVGRYGGEEFLIVLPQCSLRDAGGLAEELRGVVARTPFSTVAGSLQVRLSAGVAAFQYSDESLSLEQLLSDADTALYQAKRSGRNQVVFAESRSRPAQSQAAAPNDLVLYTPPGTGVSSPAIRRHSARGRSTRSSIHS